LGRDKKGSWIEEMKRRRKKFVANREIIDRGIVGKLEKGNDKSWII
jgi:hypothetical protein